jgi:hypothetical protein
MMLRDGKVVRRRIVRRTLICDRAAALLRKEIDNMHRPEDGPFLIGFANKADKRTSANVYNVFRYYILKLNYENPAIKAVM